MKEYQLLENVLSPQDIKNMNFSQMETLAEEIRQFLIESVSKTGGHLASNLGVVELTLALFKTLDLPKDSIIWDVGHQSYVHKLLTGRKDGFSTLRKLNGMSGFPKSSESEFDAFNTGHSSTSISAALGMTRAADIAGEQSRAVAVIGDGALTGGMAFEALNDAGTYKKNFIVVLNDNEMSISPNVGGMSRYLTRFRIRPQYFDFKSNVEHKVNRIPKVGESVVHGLKRAKDSVRHLLVPSTVFEELGFTYFGPIDGHDLPFLCQVLERAKSVNGPVLIHIKTKKGKGYKFAEDKPTDFHGIGAFCIETGETGGGGETYASTFGKAMETLGRENKNLCAVTAAMPDGTGLCAFKEAYPKRFFDVGIAEQHAVTFAAGLAKKGLRPVVAVYSSFLQRAYDQILHDVCLQNLPVVFAIDRAGVVGEDGETHQGVYDLAFLSQMPNMTILAPADFTELTQMLRYATTEHNGPVAIRYPRGNMNYKTDAAFHIGQPQKVADGGKILILSMGHMLKNAMGAFERLKEQGIAASVINLSTLWPLSQEVLQELAKNYALIVTLEDGVLSGGIGEKIKAMVGSKTQVLVKAHASGIVPHGKRDELYQMCGLDAETIANEIQTIIGQE